MTIAATSVASIPVQALAKLTAASATFQTLVGAEDADEALAHVYYLETDDRRSSDADDMTHARPRVILSIQTEQSRNDGTAAWRYNGGLSWTLEAQAPTEIEDGDAADLRDQATWFANLYGAILQEMREAIPTDPANFLNVREMNLLLAPLHNRHRDIRDNFWDVAFSMDWFG